ncbi:polysaccharide deacetylase family protein [Streptomyces sp. NPDC004838]
MTGTLAQAQPDGTRRIVAEGHQIGNHSYTHPDLVQLDAPTAFAELRDTSRTVRAQTGRAPTLFRPPFGSTDARTRQDAAGLGMTEVIWTADTVDWSGISTDAIVANALTVRPGGIILLHDGLQTTLAAIPKIVEGLAERGMCAGRIVYSATPVQAWPGLTFHAKAARWQRSGPGPGSGTLDANANAIRRVVRRGPLTAPSAVRAHPPVRSAAGGLGARRVGPLVRHEPARAQQARQARRNPLAHRSSQPSPGGSWLPLATE